MGLSANSSRTLRRLGGLGGGLLLALAAQVLLGTSAAVPAGATSVSPSSAIGPGTTLTAYRAGDHPSIAWTNVPLGTGGPSVDPIIECSSPTPTQDGTAIPLCDGASVSQPGGVKAVTDPPPAPIVIVPAPAQSGGLSPANPPLPSVGTITAAVGGGPPWTWFAVLAIVDLGLVVGVGVRHQLGQRKRQGAR